LRYFEYRKREHGGFAVDETLSQSRYPPFSAHYFWETRAAPIISVEPRILSYRPATRRPSQLVAGENVVNLPRDTSKNAESTPQIEVRGRFDALFGKEQIRIVAEIRNPLTYGT
jgi:hypothetical protein